MNIVLINQSWLYHELISLGHNVVSVGWVKNTFNITIPWSVSAEDFLQEVRNYFEPDLLLYYDNSALPAIKNIEDIKCPKIFFSVDTFHHLNWHSEFSKLFDLTLVAQKGYVDKLKLNASEGQRIEWFPLWSTVNLEPAPQKTINVSFRGTLSKTLHPERLDFFEKISNEVPIDYAEGSYDGIYTQSKIVLNQAVKDDVNFRVFEVLMSGAMLLTPKTGNGLEDLFVNGVHCVMYEPGNIDDVVSKLKYYLANDIERQKIADKGHQLAKTKYSNIATALRILDCINSIKSNGDIKNPNSSMHVQTFMVRSLWQLYRMEDNDKYLDPLEKSINHLQDLLEKYQYFSTTNSNFETSIIVADTVCSDILDPTSYKIWYQSLSSSMGFLPYVKLLDLSNGNNPEQDQARSIVQQVRYHMVKQILKVT